MFQMVSTSYRVVVMMDKRDDSSMDWRTRTNERREERKDRNVHADIAHAKEGETIKIWI